VKERASAGTREYGRSAALLTVAVGASGLLTYLFFALASHALDRDDYGRIVVLWSAMFIAISVLFRPVEQLLSRTIAELEAQDRPISRAVRVGAQIQLLVALGFTAVALVLRGEIEDRLFDGDELFFWALIASVLGFAASFFARGYLAGRRRFGLYSWLLLVDAVARASFALVVAVGIAEGADPIALGIAIAPALSVLVLPFAARGGGRAEPVPAPDAAGINAAPEFTLAEGGGFAAAILIVMVSEQVFLNSGPLFARAEEGAAAAGFIFNVLMIARAPVVLFQAAATSLLPHLTRLLSTGDESSDDAFRGSIRATIAAIAGFAALTMTAVLVAGPELMQVAFGEKFDYDRAGLVIVAGGMGFYLTATTLNQAALAQGQARRAAFCWATTAVALLAWYAVPAFDVFRRIEVGFAASAALLCALLFLVYRGPHARTDDEIRPGSPREVEARLAAADEAL
jgi:O-antigen/teichoic acid export membrane protein